MKVLMHPLAASCEELRAMTGNPPLQQAKLDISIFKAHSTRAAATSAANLNQVPIDIIMASAGWSSENTFAKFYKKPIIDQDTNFGETLLNSVYVNV
jgi:hypothetical protein